MSLWNVYWLLTGAVVMRFLVWLTHDVRGLWWMLPVYMVYLCVVIWLACRSLAPLPHTHRDHA